MKLYKIRMVLQPPSKPEFRCYATERGLGRLAASIRNRGRSQAPSPESEKMTEELAAGKTVANPYFPEISWVAECLGDRFSYCSSWLFPSKEQVEKLREQARG